MNIRCQNCGTDENQKDRLEDYTVPGNSVIAYHECDIRSTEFKMADLIWQSNRHCRRKLDENC